MYIYIYIYLSLYVYKYIYIHIFSQQPSEELELLGFQLAVRPTVLPLVPLSVRLFVHPSLIKCM